MQVRCPNCDHAIETVGAADCTELLCPSCGSSIRFDSGATSGWQASDSLPRRDKSEPDATTPWLPSDAPKRLGKFEFIEQLGAGSFGTVYKARDTELGRTVAIKIPRERNIPRPEDIDRFLREAKSAAQLSHPGIVALYDAIRGEGTCYLVSEFIHGSTLAERQSVKRFGVRGAAELVAEVADALHYAHQHGVVHRDLKPSNIMLDLDGRSHLMDFGLAKRAADEITMTLEGQVIGTPAYMSPEQAQGEVKKIDARSDLYSLGVILYELLTGELPFRGQTRMLLVQVIQDEPRPPRRLNDRIPRDLETICLKAMAKQPARRYQTGQELAADLRRYLKGEPIHARPIGPVERLWTWARRRPAVAALIGVTSAALLSFLLGSLYYNARLSEALREKEEQQARAEDYFQKAREAVDRMLTGVGENKDLEGIPLWQEHRKKFLEDALKFYKEFARESNDPAVRRETGRAYQRTGQIYLLLGEQQEAIDAYQQATVVQQALVDEFPKDLDYSRELALSYHQLGYLFAMSQNFPQAGEPFSRALQLRKQLIQADVPNPDDQNDLAMTHRELGFLYFHTDNRPQANAHLNEAAHILKRLVESDRSNTRFRISLGVTCNTRAGLLKADGELKEALDLYTQGVDTLEDVLKLDRQSTAAKAKLSETLMGRVDAFKRLGGRTNEAKRDRKRMVELGEGQTHVDLLMWGAQAQADLGNHKEAVAVVVQLQARGQEPMQSDYNFACVYSLASAAAANDLLLSESERKQFDDQYAKRSIELLEKARQNDFYTATVVDYMQSDTDLAQLQKREDFQALVADLKQDLNDSGK